MYTPEYQVIFLCVYGLGTTDKSDETWWNKHESRYESNASYFFFIVAPGRVS
jgi:hypothetical protein